MKIAFNPSTVAALTTPPNNKDITFDLRGQNIFARGVKFCGTDTNTWRDIKINNVSIGSHTLDLRNGSNTTLTNTNGVVTINSTWRPVVDNLTSNSTTSSLSANQGRVLKSLIDGKSNSGHTHDDRYLKLTGGWMSGDINFGSDNRIYWGRNTDTASISFKNDGDDDTDSYMSFVTSDNGNEYFRWSHSSGSTNTEWMALKSDGLRVKGTKVSLEGHSHNDLYYTKTEVNNKLNGKSDTSHTHDDRYLKLTGGTMTGNIILSINTTITKLLVSSSNYETAISWSVDGETKQYGREIGLHNMGGSDSTGSIAIVPYKTNTQPWLGTVGLFIAKNTLKLDGKPIALISDIPSSVKNPYSLTTFGVVYDGSAAKVVSPSNFISQVSEATATITDGTMLITSYASNNGFADTNAVNVPYKRKAIHLWEYIKAKTDPLYATKGHNHDDRYLKLTGGTMSGTIYRNSGGVTIRGRDHAIIRQTYAPGGSSWNPIACVDTETGTWTLGHLSSGSSNTDFSFCFSTNADYNAGNNAGNYVNLRNKVGTIALLSEIPNKNSWNYDDRYLKLVGGTMNGNARIGHSSGNLYIGNSGNDGWLAVQDICSQSSIGDGIWSIRTNGNAHFQSIIFPSNRLIAQVSNGSNSPLKGIKLPNLGSNGIGIFSRVSNSTDEGGIIISEDTCVIYNSFDTGWGLSVRDKDRNQTDISGDGTVAFGIRQDYRAYSLGGFEKSGSNNSYVLLGGGDHKLESSLNVANADTTDGVHIIWAGELTSTNWLAAWENDGSALRAINPANVSVGNADKANLLNSHDERVRQYLPYEVPRGIRLRFQNSNNNGLNSGGYYGLLSWRSYGIGDDLSGGYPFQIAYLQSGNLCTRVGVSKESWSSWRTLACLDSNVSSASKLQTPRSIWGQSFDGTKDVNGTIYINNGDSSNGAIRLNNNVNSNARISAIGDTVIFNTGNAIRFGGTSWDWNQWAGLKYNHSNKTIYLGIADKSIFEANSAQSGGTLNLRAGISNIDLNSGTSIRGLATNGAPYVSYITLNYGSISLSTYGDISVTSSGPGTIKLTTGYGSSASISSDIKIGSSRGVYLNSGNSGNVYLCQGGGKVGIGTTSPTQKLDVVGNIRATGQIIREGSSQMWVYGRNGALLRETSVAGYHALWSLKTTNGSWDFGEYNAGSGWDNVPVLSYITDSNYNSGNNATTYQIKFPLASGTVALTSNIPNPTNYYWANVKVSTSANTQTQPSVNTIYANNWFRSQGASGWYSESYGGGIWMNDSNWIRTYGGKSFYCDNQIYSSNSIRMGNIYLEHTDEINNSTNGGIHLNYRNSGNISLCQGGGNVGVGTTSPSYKLDVNGQMRAGGFHHGSVNSDNYMLLAGGGYKSFGGDDSTPIFLGYLNLDHGNDGTVSSSFYCLGYSVPFTYTRGGNYCRITIPDTTRLSFYINAAIASVNYSGGGMDTWVGEHRSAGAWWLHCYASGWNEVRVKGFRQSNNNNDSWWGGNPLFSNNDGANRITVCIFGHVRYK